MKFIKKIKWVIVALLLICISGWFYINYSDRDFLRYGALHIKKLPPTLNLLDYHTYGISDFRAEYFISVNPNEFGKLISGRKYKIRNSNNADFLSIAAVGAHPSGFLPDLCYTSGSYNDGMVQVFTNKSKSLIYVVYDIQ
jgi:hypothetical protein